MLNIAERSKYISSNLLMLNSTCGEERAGKAADQNKTAVGVHYAFTRIHMLRNFNPCFAVNYFSLLMYTAPSHSHLQT